MLQKMLLEILQQPHAGSMILLLNVLATSSLLVPIFGSLTTLVSMFTYYLASYCASCFKIAVQYLLDVLLSRDCLVYWGVIVLVTALSLWLHLVGPHPFRVHLNLWGSSSWRFIILLTTFFLWLHWACLLLFWTLGSRCSGSSRWFMICNVVQTFFYQ